MSNGKIWLVEHPLFQYKEDVKALARKNDLRVVDAAFADSVDPKQVEEKPPKLTRVGEQKVG